MIRQTLDFLIIRLQSSYLSIPYSYQKRSDPMRTHNFLKRISLLALLLCIPLQAANAKKPWTFLVYLAADNNLNTFADLNLNQMMKIGSNANINVLVYLTIKRNGEQKKTQKLIIHQGSVEQVGPTTQEDSGSPDTLIKALDWAFNNFPADHYAVDLWDHGSGPLNRTMMDHRGICYDDSTGNYLTDLDYKHAFDVAVNQYLHGQKIDIVMCDACLMADIEVAYTLQNYANYLVSSQETIPGAGYDYTAVLAPFAKGTQTPQDFAKGVVTAYDTAYKYSRQSYTLSAMNLALLNDVTNSLNQISQLLLKNLKTDSQRKLRNAIIKSTKAPCPHFTEATYMDLYMFYYNLSTALATSGVNTNDLATLKVSLTAAMKAITQCVFAVANSNNYLKARGVSIYFPDFAVGVEPSYNDLYWSTTNPSWLNLITALARG
jgi:hypothetical protein